MGSRRLTLRCDLKRRRRQALGRLGPRLVGYLQAQDPEAPLNGVLGVPLEAVPRQELVHRLNQRRRRGMTSAERRRRKKLGVEVVTCCQMLSRCCHVVMLLYVVLCYPCCVFSWK